MKCNNIEDLNTIAEEARKLGDTELVDSVEKVLGSDYNGKLGSSYKGADTSYWNTRKKAHRTKLAKLKSMENTYVSVVNNEDNTQKQEKIKSVKIQGDAVTIRYDNGDYDVFDKETGIDTTGYKEIDVTPFKDLGSESSADIEDVKWSDMKRLEKEVHGNVEGMKELVDRLADMDESNTEEEIEYYKNILGMIPQSFYGKAKTYVKEGMEQAEGRTRRRHNAKTTNIELLLSNKKKRTESAKSNVEVYTHEVIHTLTEFALEQNTAEARKARREISYIMKEALKHIGPASFIDKKAENQELEAKLSEEMYSYIFESDNALEEFIAHAVTNPRMMKRLKAIKVKDKNTNVSMFQRIKTTLSELMDMVLGNYKFRAKDKNAYEQMMDLTQELAEINGNALNKVEAGSSMGMDFMDKLNDVDEAVSNKLQDLINKYLIKDGKIDKPPAKGGVSYAIWLGKVLGKMFTHPEYRKSLSMILTSYGIKPEGDLQTIGRDFVEPDELSKAVDWLSLASDVIDQTRTTLDATVSKNILDGFGEKLSEREESALQRVVVDLDMESMYDKYSNANLRKLLTDDEYLTKEIGRVKHKLKVKDKENYNWNSIQAKGLGHYLVTNKGNIIQNMNAYNIATGVLGKGLRKTDKETVDLIDTLATLHGMEYANSTDKAIVADKMKNEWKGVRNLIDIHKSYKEDSKDQLFEHNVRHTIKGYSKSIFSDQITMEIAPLDEKTDLERRGFKLKKKLGSNEHNKYGKPMGLYISNSFEVSDWHRGAARLNRNGRKGTSIGESLQGTELEKKKHKLMKIKIDTDRLKMVNAIEKGEADLTSMDSGIMPLIDEHGAVTDYRYVMDKHAKEEYLGLSTKVSDVVGKSIGTIRDKIMTKELNKKVLKSIQGDMKENYIPGSNLGKNDRVYVLISPDSTEEKIRELYKVMPPEFKKAAQQDDTKGLAVRRDLLHTYFGFRHVSLTDFPGLKQVTPAVVRNIIKTAEAIWSEFIKLTKVDILIKMPVVIVGNIVSNIMYGIMTGTGPIEILKMYKESSRDVRSYIKDHRRLVELELKKRTSNITRKEESEMEMLLRDLKDNPVKELADLGMYQAIVEDIDREDLVSTNKLKDMLKRNVTSKLPKWAQTAGQWAYLSEETGYYKFMSEVLQMSDLVARDIENRKLKKIEEQQVSGVKPLPRWWTTEHEMESGTKEKLIGNERKEFLKEAKKRRHETVLTAFINYNKPSGTKEEYLNRMGAIMFTKYMKRIQRVIGTTGIKHPIKSLAILAGQEFLLDVDTIQDQSLLNRSWYNLGMGPGDLIPGLSQLDHIMDVVTPPIIQKSTYQLF